MPLGSIDRSRADTYFSSDEALALLRPHFDLVSSAETTGGPARYWRIPGTRTSRSASSRRIRTISATAATACASPARASSIPASARTTPCP
jgi:molybdenum cofactor biosynthesis enzyme MoaA